SYFSSINLAEDLHSVNQYFDLLQKNLGFTWSPLISQQREAVSTHLPPPRQHSGPKNLQAG
ncbi:hypothetical protein, partial [Roseomonas marmotae]|uniref:hypothetical protein n=1 Tax=Roseomonas marmotae TaxID=2768161 RepID=UPI001A95DF06